MIVGPSARRELVAVIRAAVAIVFCVWMYLANSPYAAATNAPGRGALAPFQALIADRPVEEQRMFRELQVALLEAENIRSMEGQWPTADAMASEGIEPFAANPSLKGVRYSWKEFRDGRFINYLGTPEGRAPSWLLSIQEPDPAAPETFRADEEHHQLLDGSVLHVSIWSLPDSMRAPARISRAPQFEGWTQLFAIGPSTTHSGAMALPPASSPR